MTMPNMALSELAEKRVDADLLREMIQYIAQRMMDMDVEGRSLMDNPKANVPAHLNFPKAHRPPAMFTPSIYSHDSLKTQKW